MGFFTLSSQNKSMKHVCDTATGGCVRYNSRLSISCFSSLEMNFVIRVVNLENLNEHRKIHILVINIKF